MEVLDQAVYVLCSVHLQSYYQHYYYIITPALFLFLFLSSFLPAHPLKSHFVDKHSLAFSRSCSGLFTMFLHNKEMRDNHEN